jgi:outer membrane protein TolC
MTIGKDCCVRRILCVLIAVATAMCGCTPVRYREAADKETYRIIAEKQEAVFGQPETGFTVEKPPMPQFMEASGQQEERPSGPVKEPISLELSKETLELLSEEEGELDIAQRLLSSKLTDEKIATLGDVELRVLLKLSYDELAELIIPTPPSAVKLTLPQSLELAVANSRQFQDQKERLFLSALSLTLERHLWRPQLGLTGSATGSKQGDDKSIAAGSKFSFGQALASGAQFALNLGINFAEFLTGDKRRAIGSVLTSTFSQPLLRGGGRLVAMENLTQAERNVIYDVRSYTRFRRQFSVQVADSYYGVLETRDNLINNFQNYISLRRETIRLQAMFNEKRTDVTLLQVDEARQDELVANNAWISGRQSYLDQLDQFKISPLGLPTETPVVLDQDELKSLRKKAEGGLPPPEIGVEEAVSRALAYRLDLMNSQDALDDAERAAAIARDALRAGLDFTISTSADTEPPTKAVKFQFDEGSYSAGLVADLPIDRKQERNAYRRALIALESQKRSLSLLRDNIKLAVRQAYRGLEQARSSYEIQNMSVDLARRRVDNAVQRHELGLAEPRDVLFARRSLLTAQNALTAALARHEIAKLELWLSMEELRVDEKGEWAEVKLSAEGGQNDESTKRSEEHEKELSQS